MKRNTENAIIAELLVSVVLYAAYKRPTAQAKRNLVAALRKAVRKAGQLALKTSTEEN